MVRQHGALDAGLDLVHGQLDDLQEFQKLLHIQIGSSFLAPLLQRISLLFGRARRQVLRDGRVHALRLFATALAAITREEEPFAEFTVLALAATRVAAAEAVMADMPIATSLRL